MSNRFLYDKSSYEFKNLQKKERAWLEMEQKMRLNPGDLYRWYTSLRTQYVKEMKKREDATRTGAGAVDEIVTPRITWLMQKFEFVKPYVCQSRATRGSRIHKSHKHSDCSESPFPSEIRESTPQSSTTSKTTDIISDCLEKVSQQLAVPKNDIEKTCDFLSVLMTKMTPSCLEDFTNETICKAMEYVKQSNQERRRIQQPTKGSVSQTPSSPFTLTEQLQQSSQPASIHYIPFQGPAQLATANKPRLNSTTELRQPLFISDNIMARNLAASNPPVHVLQGQGQYQWTDFQPSNVQPILSDQLQSSAYSPQIPRGNLTTSNASSSSTDAATVLTGAYEVLQSELQTQ